MSDGYVTTRKFGGFRYTVELGHEYIGGADTRWGARRLIAKHRRHLARWGPKPVRVDGQPGPTQHCPTCHCVEPK